jgi:hypothetical protein
MHSGGTMRGQHERTVDMLQDMIRSKPLWEVLFFLYDCQTELGDLKHLAEIAQKRSGIDDIDQGA